MAIGISGGLEPCPSALVLLLSAIALRQIAYGLVLIGGFSLGLASVLTSLGVAAVYGQQWLEKSPFGAGVMQRLSVVSAFAYGLHRLGSDNDGFDGIKGIHPVHSRLRFTVLQPKRCIADVVSP